MLKRFLCVCICLLTVLCTCGCALNENGYSLSAFCNRINSLDKNYGMLPTGYIIDKNNSTLTKFFRFSEKEIMLEFTYDKSNRLTALNIVFDNSEKNNSDEEKFIKNCIYAFIDDASVTDSLLAEIDFSNTFYIVDINTKKAKIGNIEILIDATEIGTIITVAQNIP